MFIGLDRRVSSIHRSFPIIFFVIMLVHGFELSQSNHVSVDDMGIENSHFQLSQISGTASWTEFSPSNTPSFREHHVIVFDSINEKIILFGGYDGASQHDDGWFFDTATASWENLFLTTRPTARSSHSMAYDSVNEKIILFGGQDFNNRMDDTWYYSFSQSIDTWIQLAPSNSPSARSRHSMVYDAVNEKVILFGGYDGNDRLEDTWAFDFSTQDWTQLFPTNSPSARYDHAMIYDSVNGKVILFGGSGTTSVTDDTWIFDYNTVTWERVFPTSKPTARSRHEMVYDSVNEKAILFGSTATSDDDTWIFDYSSNTWTKLSALTRPHGRWGHSMAYDSVNEKVILFGGFHSSGSNSDTWGMELMVNIQSGSTITDSSTSNDQTVSATITDTLTSNDQTVTTTITDTSTENAKNLDNGSFFNNDLVSILIISGVIISGLSFGIGRYLSKSTLSMKGNLSEEQLKERKILEIVYCIECGTSNDHGRTNCSVCGSKLLRK